MTAHLSETVWKWGDEVSDFVIREIGDAIRENKEWNASERPKDPPSYTPGAYMIMSDADAMVLNIGQFLDIKVENGEVSLTDIDTFTKDSPDPKAAKQIMWGVISYLGYEFIP
jgi:hypothetical protein